MYRLLQLLSDGRFHSGAELGALLGVTRAAVWKKLQLLEKSFSISLERISGKGYRLASPISLLDESRLSSALGSLGWSVFLREEIDSTNAEALRLLQCPTSLPFIVVAESQTAGRGRRGRRWASPPVRNLYCSFALRVEAGGRHLSGMSLAVGLAVVDTLRSLGVPGVGLKWPNDVYVDGKKVAGILLELTGDPADQCHVVIGIGINVNMTFSVDEIDQPWTSLRSVLGALVDRNELLLRLAMSLSGYLERHISEGFSALRAEWEAVNVWQGLMCRLSAGSQEVLGRVLGVDDHGALRLDVDGCIYVFSGGELSLRLDHDS
ncbi:bifunctional biotin--[acetyl-CoA-carboxylase] ligase/biotin operon repressor BirA [Stutzerimonas kirkiae]|uniref:Bifunctional ligase/repressor BirA n=1 Tax=Stutzerimonas kirkiae TaxID=2211392 RepID=A0A4Q9QV06_9GAMM|nr:bifunctional biotin--[acetyl-CoA-carboxylase] ligase/biotin operon repressor BirA [Stutzerimonas kirkiae]TBU87504.1 bifunctional biotin--[acetyl-CoA-carboxylase] synthetase/biotin operon repressor [Stutzerimonas kirkiae]TBU97858.1 bifunctional biotin--[acetyl-CoA-carboxylase] synthetase/biotin operon repressor [Stutzerimonas kirkiae]TBV08788.1 bifunctional biotin--[acetyl-CoA-carboxylase] synthetase/biotin operon repressor [Stutzerimonas kirkiae]TBV11428.1 bifunctional biotin--[acetyl-CoA-ca